MKAFALIVGLLWGGVALADCISLTGKYDLDGGTVEFAQDYVDGVDIYKLIFTDTYEWITDGKAHRIYPDDKNTSAEYIASCGENFLRIAVSDNINSEEFTLEFFFNPDHSLLINTARGEDRNGKFLKIQALTPIPPKVTSP